MKRRSGFTLIELMVVMAIIAILATSGLSAYSGYIRKARDAKRIADINAINNIVIGMMGANGTPPGTAKAVYDAVLAANNGVPLIDPLSTNNGTMVKSTCINHLGVVTGSVVCSYGYRLCDGGLGYAVGTRFESASNLSFYTNRSIQLPAWPDRGMGLEIGSCQTSCNAGISGCEGGWNNAAPVIIDVNGWSLMSSPW